MTIRNTGSLSFPDGAVKCQIFEGRVIKHLVIGTDENGYQFVDIETKDGFLFRTWEHAQAGEMRYELGLKEESTNEE